MPDDLVDRVTTDLRYSAADGGGLAGELCAALIWETADGGYRVLDAQAVHACAERASELRVQAGNPARPERPPAQSVSGEPGDPAGHEHVTGENGTGPEPRDQIRLDRSWTLDGKDRVLSPAAYQLHLRGTTDAARSERPGFITDAYLTGHGPATTAAVTELITTGLWNRSSGGYRVLDTVMIQMAAGTVAELRHRAAELNWLRLRTEQEELVRRTREAKTGSPGAVPPRA